MRLLIISFFLSVNVFAAGPRAWYISNAGSDANSGLSTTTAWASIDKLNTSWASIAAGDSVLFRCGDTFTGSIIVGQNNIYFGSFNSGAKPILTGFQTLTGWTNSGGGVWKINVPTATREARLFTINGQIQRLGRYPNANATNGGYLTYNTTSFGPPFTITDNSLTTATNWAGAIAVVRKSDFVIDTGIITNHTGGTLTINYPTYTTPGNNGYGYFIQNDIRTLDQFGEWYLNQSTKDLSVYFGGNSPSSYNLAFSTQDTIINCGDGGYNNTGRTSHYGITVNNLEIDGANDMGYYNRNGNNNVVTNCIFNNNYNAISIWYSQYNTINNNTITNTLNNGIMMLPGSASPTLSTINYNTIRNCGMYVGMGENGLGVEGKNSYSAITEEGSNCAIESNRVDSVGFNGIKFGTPNSISYPGNISVRYNYVTNFNTVKDDGGGIYCYQTVAQTTNQVQYNTVSGGIGALYGKGGAAAGTNGIYVDNDCTNINVSNNSVSNINSVGIFSNTCNYLTVSSNNIYNVPVGIQINRYPGSNASPSAYVRNNTITKNIIYATTANFQYSQGQLKEPSNITIQQDMRLIGRIDSNYILNNLAQPFTYYWQDSANNYSTVPAQTHQTYYVNSLNLSQWQTYMNQEANTKTIVTTPAATYITNPTSSTYDYAYLGLSNKLVDGTVNNEHTFIAPYGSALLFANGSYTAPVVIPTAGTKAILNLKRKRYRNG